MLTRDDDETYANTPATDRFLDPAKPSYLGGLLEMADARLYPFWGRLTEGLRTGLPQNEAGDGGDFFAALYADGERRGQFLHAMTSVSAGASHAIAARFPWQDHGTVLDIGCAEGGLLVASALAHPHLRGTGLDLPPARPAARRAARRRRYRDGRSDPSASTIASGGRAGGPVSQFLRARDLTTSRAGRACSAAEPGGVQGSRVPQRIDANIAPSSRASPSPSKTGVRSRSVGRLESAVPRPR